MAVDPSETRVGSGFQAFVKLSKTADENMLYNMFLSMDGSCFYLKFFWMVLIFLQTL